MLPTTLPLLLRRLPLPATVPLPRPIGRETGGNSGLTVLTDAPGVIGVAGVGCIQLCCAIRGSVVFIADVTAVAVGVRLVDNDALTPTVLTIDVVPLLLSCTGG